MHNYAATTRPVFFQAVFIAFISILVSSTAIAHKKVPVASGLKISDTTAVIYNTPTAVSLGQNRLIIRSENSRGQFYGGPDTDITIRLTQGATKLNLPTYWVWVSEGYNGFYVANVNFKSTGQWLAQLSDDTGQSKELLFTVSANSVVPAIGQQAIASVTKTLGDKEYSDLTTDDDPNPAFYQHTIAEVVDSGKPSVLVFATPDLCRTAVCGPVLKEVKKLAKRWPDVNFVHVEIYEPVKKTNNQLIPVQAVIDWQLPSEPWTFLVDANGNVSARYEGYITASEIDVPLAALQ